MFSLALGSLPPLFPAYCKKLSSAKALAGYVNSSQHTWGSNTKLLLYMVCAASINNGAHLKEHGFSPTVFSHLPDPGSLLLPKARIPLLPCGSVVKRHFRLGKIGAGGFSK